MELDTINKLYLELSQVATATTKREMILTDALNRAYLQIMGATYIDDAEAAEATEAADKILEVLGED